MSITLDHINSFFDLNAQLEDLNVAPTATGGTGINNMQQFPPPRPTIPQWRKVGTDYVKKYLDKEKNEQFLTRRQTLELPGSTVSLTTLEDVDDNSTAITEGPAVNELHNEETRQIYSTYFNEAANYDPDLPITSYREQILQQLDINPVLIIQGPTGCGKTTQVPQYILDYHQSRGRYCNIIVTQPRKIAAISISNRVCKERNWETGTIVGYQVAMDQKISSSTCISYVTTGVLLEKLVNAKRMDMYTHIIIDEVHERDQEVDFALLIVKKFLKLNSPRVKVILMSATFDSSAFAKYFSMYEKSGPAPVIDIIGKSKLVNEYYLYELKTLKSLAKVPEFDMNNPMIDNCLYETVLQLLYYFDKIEKAEQNVPLSQTYAPQRGAVLVFLPGYEEISRLCNVLQKDNLDLQLNGSPDLVLCKSVDSTFSQIIQTQCISAYRRSIGFWIIPLHSSITVEEQQNVFKPPHADHRKIIISTNIAESSITVPDVKYVIDFCLTKNLVTDTTTNYTCLQLEWASKANCIQRKGRAGRVDIGRVYRMVPREFYNKFPEYGIPEIKRCPLTRTILQLKRLNLCEPQEMLAFALDPPDLSDIGNAVLHLKEALALTSRSLNPFDGDLTFIGRVMSNLPLDIKLSKLIVFGYVFRCLDDCIIIAASLSLQSFFSRPFQKVLDAYKSRLAWDDSTFSDCLVYLNAYKVWKQLSQQGQFRRPGGKTEAQWASSNFIQIRRINEVDKLVKEIKSRLEKQHIRSEHHSFKHDEKSVLVLKMVIAGAFFPHYFLQQPLDEKTIMRDLNLNDPHSTVLVSGLPPKHGILYASALKDMFTCCSNNIVIEFEEKKAYIKFARSASSSSSNVLQPVYLAVKMRKLGLPLELTIFSPEEADRKCQQILSSKNQNRDHRLMPNRVTVKFEPQMELKRIEVPPPGKSGIIDILITHVVNCGSFWARIISPSTNNLMRFLDMTIQYDQYRNLKVLSKKAVANMLCLAPFTERGKQDYYRAQVKKLRSKESLAEVFFIDYGNTERVKISDLREIDEKTPDVYTTPALAVECSLAEVKPFRSPTGEWNDKATEWFKTKVSGIQIQAKIYSVVNDVMKLELNVKDRSGIIHFLNKEMVEVGLAEPAEESFASKQNHEVREKASLYGNMEGSVFENVSNDVQVSWKSENTHDVHTLSRKIKLHGPYNPLEVEYSGMTFVDRSKSMKVERDSVNSVSFNPDPQEPYSAMLVAACLGVGQSSHDLIARNTTLMPKMRGLPSLVCLLFSPFAEIRINRERSRYTGVLCGLGYDPRNGDPIYPDHDIELPFDIRISMEDISEINGIRMGVNLLLHSQTDILQYESHQTQNIHQQTRRTILQLLERQWQPKEPEYSRNPHRWDQVESHLLLETSVSESADHPDVLPLLKPPSLVVSKGTQKMLDHLDHLYSFVEDITSRDFELIRCELCSVDVVSKRDLLVHLDSTAHQRRERKIKLK